MQVPEEYYEDSVVGGFYVTGMMKRCWAAQIEVLEDIAALCKKHNIRYFADAGTLIGTIRHGGFIPWDDDLDIVMMREDYEEFLKHADELPDNYTLLNWRQRDDWNDIFTRVVNATALTFDPAFMSKYHDFPFSAGVDIFVNDYLYKDEKKEKEREELIQIAYSLARNAQQKIKNKRQFFDAVDKLEALSGYRINRKGNLVKELYALEDKLLSEVPREEADEAVLMPAWMEYDSNRYDINWYEDAIELPFEHSTIMVPTHYDEILKNKYGNYLHANRIGGCHDYPYYYAQYDILSERTGWKRPLYYFNDEDLKLSENIRAEEIKKQDALKDQVAQIESLMNSQDNAQIFASLVPQVEALKASLRDMQQKNRDVVFLPYRADIWDRLDHTWRKEMADPDSDVYVIPVPYYSMNLDGTTGNLHYDLKAYPAEVGAMSFEDYDLANRHPKRIYIQVPYDGYNPAASVHPFFYSKELVRYTDELVYIPYFPVTDIVEGDEKGKKSLDYFVKMPGLVNADRVLLDSETMKQTYVDSMTELCGKDTRELWEKKIEVIPDLYEIPKKEKNGMKSIFYYTDVCPFLAEGKTALDKLRRNLDIFKESREDIRLIWHPFNGISDYLREKAPETSVEYEKIVDAFKSEGWGVYDESEDGEAVLADCVAYYGDPSPFVYRAQMDKKPVMIADIHV